MAKHIALETSYSYKKVLPLISKVTFCSKIVDTLREKRPESETLRSETQRLNVSFEYVHVNDLFQALGIMVTISLKIKHKAVISFRTIKASFPVLKEKDIQPEESVSKTVVIPQHSVKSNK